MKEFNKYRNYLAEVQLDWDHRFRAEQKELVRMLLFMQKDGKLSSDVPITDVMEWILFEGSGVFTLEFRKAKDKPERLIGTGDCSRIQLPKIYTQSAFYSSECKHFLSRSEKVSTDCFYSIVGNIVTLVVKGVNGILIPAMQSFESRPALKKNITASEKSPLDVLDCEHPGSLSVDHEVASRLCLERFSGEQEDRRRSTSPSSHTSELLNPGLIKEAERIIWEVIWKQEIQRAGKDISSDGKLLGGHFSSRYARSCHPSRETSATVSYADNMVDGVLRNIEEDTAEYTNDPAKIKHKMTPIPRATQSEKCGSQMSDTASQSPGGSLQLPVESAASQSPGGSPQLPVESAASQSPGGSPQLPVESAASQSPGGSPQLPVESAASQSPGGSLQLPVESAASQSPGGSPQLPVESAASQSPGGSLQLPLESDPRREAARVSYRVFEKIKENISTFGQGLVQPGKVNKEVEDVLILGIVETALEKLEDITKQEKRMNLNSEKNTVETVPVSVLDSGCKTALYSGHTEVCIEIPPQPLSSKSLLTYSCGSQADIVSDKVVGNDVCEVQRLSSQERSYNSTEQAEAVCDSQHMVEDILQVLKAQGTPIVQYEPRTFDRVSSSISQAMFKHTSKTALDTESSEHPRWLTPDASPEPRASTADSGKSRGMLPKLATLKAQGPRGTQLKMKKECRSHSTTLTSDVVETPSPHIPDDVMVGQRVDAEVSSPATGDRKEWDKRGLGVGVIEPPHNRDHFSSRAQTSEKVTHNRSICKRGLEQKLSAPSMLLLRSTVEKLVNKWMDHFSVANLFLSASEEMERQGSRPCDLFQTSGGQTEKVTGSSEVASPHLCNFVTQSVMGSLQLDHSPNASTKNAVDVGPIMWPACSMKPDPPWSGSALGNPSGEPASLVKAPVQTQHCHHNTMDQGISVLTPLESSAQQEPDTACKKPAWFYVIGAQPEPGEGISAPESLCTCLEYLHSLPIEVLEDIVSCLIVNIYSDGGDLHTCLSSPTLSDTAVDLIDDVLNELKISPNDVVVCGDLVMPESCTFEVARSVHRELLSYSGSHESLRQAVSTSKDHMVKKIASSISLEVSKVASRIGAVNLDDAPPSPAPGGDTDASLVSCPATNISEDIVLRVLDIIPFSQSPEAKWIGLQGSTDMRRDLLDAVMVELLTSPPMLTLSVSAARSWRQPSREELDGAARQIYQKMVDQCGSEEALESALRLRTKLVNAALANTVANEVFQLFSDERFYSATTHDQATDMDDCSAADHRLSYTSRGVCAVNCKAMWEIIYRLLQESCPNMLMEAQLIRYSLEYFYSALERLSRCEELKVCWDQTACGACRDPWATDFIASRVRQRSQERMGSEVRLGPALDPRDKAVVQCVVDLVAEETLLFMSHHHVISIPAAVLMAKDDTSSPGKEDGDSNEFTRKGLLSAIKGFFGFNKTGSPSPVDCVVHFHRRGQHVLSGKIKKRSRRGRFITLEERKRRLAEQMRTCDSQMSDKSDTGFTSEQQPDRHLRGRFGWVLSKLMCAEDIYSMDCL
ncbi:uncharacterized protein LOC134023792 [Osmerus eperlanus]|uniref:uncharacterized protein LOC134023792 n=1 Tax=Osmerus eperlanus TaxID=29151 RepID=UPI002E0ECBB5